MLAQESLKEKQDIYLFNYRYNIFGSDQSIN